MGWPISGLAPAIDGSSLSPVVPRSSLGPLLDPRFHARVIAIEAFEDAGSFDVEDRLDIAF
jgi:hypothetical protein